MSWSLKSVRFCEKAHPPCLQMQRGENGLLIASGQLSRVYMNIGEETVSVPVHSGKTLWSWEELHATIERIGGKAGKGIRQVSAELVLMIGGEPYVLALNFKR